MRTSRLAKETAKLLSALSPSKASSRASISTETTHTHANGRATRASRVKVETDDADSLPTHDTSTPSITTPTSRKRKRDIDETASPQIKTEIEETTTIRASPRHKPSSSHTDIPRKAKRQPAKRIVHANGEVEISPPQNWQEMYETTAAMRKLWPAAVDTMGCESLADEQVSPRDQRFQTLIALMLSSQTKDTVTSAAIKNLQQNLPGGLNLESILAIDPQTLNNLISKVGFHNNKTRFIQATAAILRDDFASDIPSTIEGLVSLPGVGPKMAYLCMSAAWGRDEGIGVDVHVHRITNLWGWHKTRTPEETRAALEAWLPRDKWHPINHLLVGFGQTWCPPVGRKCVQCHLAQKGLCPSAVVSQAEKATWVKVEVDGEEGGENVLVKSEVNFDVKVEQDEKLALPVLDIEDLGRPVVRRRR